MTEFSTGIPNIRVVVRENTETNLSVNVPNLSVVIQDNADYNVNIIPTAVTPTRTGSWNTIADVALTAISSSYASTASYAINASGFPYSGSAVITGSLLITGSTSASLFIINSDIIVDSIRIGGGPQGVTQGDNIVFGRDALSSNTTGVYNTALGHDTLNANRTGIDNTAVGYSALSSSVSGSSNVAIGAFSLTKNLTGSKNVAVGSATMFYNTYGNYNTALGAFALLHNETGSNNVAVGNQALEYSHGDFNLAIGTYAGRYVSGNYNVIIGAFNGNQGGYDFRTGSNFIVIADGQSNVRAHYHGVDNAWVFNVDGIEATRLDSSSFKIEVPVSASQITGSLYGTASVADGIDVIFAGTFETGSGSYIIPSPSGGLSYVTSASYATTASYVLNTVSASYATTASYVLNAVSASYATTASYFEGTMQGVQEEIILSSSVGATTSSFDFSNASIFYLTGMTGNGVWNITNVPTTAQKATTFTFVLEQGATPYSASGYQLNSSNVTVKWLGSTTPTGSANKTDVIGLTALRSGSTWNVVGVLSSFG